MIARPWKHTFALCGTKAQQNGGMWDHIGTIYVHFVAVMGVAS